MRHRWPTSTRSTQRLKGTARPVNAGVGNLGVAVIQLIGLLVLATAGHQAPYWVCAVYLVLLTIVGIAAALFMDNLDHGVEPNHMRSILFDRDTWAISMLYICTFGSWIGFSFAFGQVLQVNYLAMAKRRGTRRCMPPKSPSLDHYWAHWPASTAAGWPIASAVAVSRSASSPA